MSIHFRPLFTVDVAHGYYRGPCAEVDFSTPADPALLAGGRLLARNRDGRLHVLYEARADGTPIAPLAGTTLLFGLQVANPHFVNFTQAPVAAGQLPLFANRSQPRTLDAPLPAAFGAALQHVRPQSATRPLTLRWHDGLRLVAEQVLTAGQDQASFATRDWPPGVYTLTEDDGGSVRQGNVVIAPELAGRGLWGVLAVSIDAGFYGAPAAFTINLAARREQLKYYVVARNYGANEFSQLAVSDAGAGEQGRPAIQFDAVTRDHFAADDIPADLLGDAAARIVLFQSRNAVDRRAGGYRKLQLARNGEILVQHLPQAGSDRGQARFIVHLSKP